MIGYNWMAIVVIALAIIVTVLVLAAIGQRRNEAREYAELRRQAIERAKVERATVAAELAAYRAELSAGGAPTCGTRAVTGDRDKDWQALADLATAGYCTHS